MVFLVFSLSLRYTNWSSDYRKDTKFLPMKQYKMKPFTQAPAIHVSVPGSKSITNRALLLAALSEGKSVLKGVLFSEDSRVFMEALQTLGYAVDIEEEKREVSIVGQGCHIPVSDVSVYVGSAGTAARFLTAFLALSGGRYEVTSSEQMKGRPMRPLLEALEQLGAEFEFQEKPYSFPFTICGRREVSCGKVELNIDASSQFLSALLLSSVLVKDGFLVQLTGKRDAKAYVKISMKMMEEFGCTMEQESENEYRLLPGQRYYAREYQIEPDVSAACYFYAMAAVSGGTAMVDYVKFDSTQGDIKFLKVLEQMGCSLEETEKGIRLTGTGTLHGVDVKMSDFSDQTMTLAAVAVFADSQTKITGVAHIRRQESDRIAGIVTELRRLGIRCEEEEDGITIYPGGIAAGEHNPVVVQTYEDHRMAMAFAIIGTRVPGIIIDNPMCCSKTFEKYFDILTNLHLRLE
jgi:3-phosphoshikimate 1-carboxyvinyltransferase